MRAGRSPCSRGGETVLYTEIDIACRDVDREALRAGVVLPDEALAKLLEDYSS